MGDIFAKLILMSDVLVAHEKVQEFLANGGSSEQYSQNDHR